MKKKWDWGKISTIIAALALCWGIFTYFRPSDPTHPASLDFLSRSVEVAPWLLLSVLVLAIAVTTIVTRRYFPTNSVSNVLEIARLKGRIAQYEETQARTIPVDDPKREKCIDELKMAIRNTTNELAIEKGYHQDYEKRCATLTTEKAALQSKIDALIDGFVGSDLLGIQDGKVPDSRPPKPFDFDRGRKLVKFSWKEGLAIEISYNASPYGLILSVLNDSPNWIGAFRAEVANAESWNETHNKFLETRGFSRKLVIRGDTLAPISRTKGIWIVRIARNSLEITDQGGTSLDWPNNDPATIQTWRISLVLWYDPVAGSRTNMKFLNTVFLLVRWDRDSGKLAIADGNATALVR